MQQQLTFVKARWDHRFSHGGILRNQRQGRQMRPLSTKDSLHLVLKANRQYLHAGFRSYRRFTLIHEILRTYARRFNIKIEQISVQGDHIHLLIRTTKRSRYQSFFRVFSGQIAQRFQQQNLIRKLPPSDVTDTPRNKAKLWKHRPFTRVIKGWKAYQIVRNYIQLNEKEALGEIPYRKSRLKGLTIREWGKLWS